MESPVPLVKEKQLEKIRRPLNAFMVWSRIQRRKIALEHPGMHNFEISKRLGVEWKQLDENKKRSFKYEAERLRQEHKRLHPNFQYHSKHKPKPVAKSAKLKPAAETAKPKLAAETAKPKLAAETAKPKQAAETAKLKPAAENAKPKPSTETAKPKSVTETAKPKPAGETAKPSVSSAFHKRTHIRINDAQNQAALVNTTYPMHLPYYAINSYPATSEYFHHNLMQRFAALYHRMYSQLDNQSMFNSDLWNHNEKSYGSSSPSDQYHHNSSYIPAKPIYTPPTVSCGLNLLYANTPAMPPISSYYSMDLSYDSQAYNGAVLAPPSSNSRNQHNIISPGPSIKQEMENQNSSSDAPAQKL